MSVRTIRRATEVFEDAAQLIELLAAVEKAHLLEDAEQLDTLLTQVTETQCSGLAQDLRFYALVDREQDRRRVERGQERTEFHWFETPPQVPPQATGAGDGAHVDSQSDESLAQVVHLDPWNRRV